MALATMDEVASLEGLAMTPVTSELAKAGQPVFVSPDGTLRLASAAAGSNRAVVDGIARQDTSANQSCAVENRTLTLPDWSFVIGAPTLAPGTRYFLDGTLGRLTATAPNGIGQAVIGVGVAISPQTLIVRIVPEVATSSASGATLSQVDTEIASAFEAHGVPDGETVPNLITQAIAAQGSGQGVSASQSVINALVFGG